MPLLKKALTAPVARDGECGLRKRRTVTFGGCEESSAVEDNDLEARTASPTCVSQLRPSPPPSIADLNRALDSSRTRRRVEPTRVVTFQYAVRQLTFRRPDAALKSSLWHTAAETKGFTRAEILRRRRLGITTTSIIMPSTLAYDSDSDDDSDDGEFRYEFRRALAETSPLDIHLRPPRSRRRATNTMSPPPPPPPPPTHLLPLPPSHQKQQQQRSLSFSNSPPTPPRGLSRQAKVPRQHSPPPPSSLTPASLLDTVLCNRYDADDDDDDDSTSTEATSTEATHEPTSAEASHDQKAHEWQQEQDRNAPMLIIG